MKKTLLTCFAILALVAGPASAQIINEYLADPASGLDGDANGDGTRNGSEDEFVEIYNDTGNPLDISGWTIEDAFTITDTDGSIDPRHEFPPNTVIPAGCAIVVFGGGTPTGSFGGSIVQVSSNGFLGLNNGGDTIYLTDGDINNIIVQHTYGAEGGDNQSVTRDPDLTGTLDTKHTVATGSGGSFFSPGTQINGSPFSGCGTVAVEESTWGGVKAIFRK